nr:hypothetical protein [Panacibacter microcysteis]
MLVHVALLCRSAHLLTNASAVQECDATDASYLFCSLATKKPYTISCGIASLPYQFTLRLAYITMASTINNATLPTTKAQRSK